MFFGQFINIRPCVNAEALIETTFINYSKLKKLRKTLAVLSILVTSGKNHAEVCQQQKQTDKPI